MPKEGFYYLASPYTCDDPDPGVRRETEHKRHRSAIVAAKAIMLRGYSVFSPIVHSVPLVQDDVLPNFHDFWMDIDLPILAKAQGVIVLPLPGWTQSKGVQQEIKLADSLGIPVKTFADFMAVSQ